MANQRLNATITIGGALAASFSKTVGSVRSQLGTIGGSFGGLAQNQNRLGSAIRRNDMALANARGGVMDAVGAFYALKAAIGGPINAAMQFESAMADVKKVVTFDDGADLKVFENGLLEMTKRVPIAVDGLAKIAAAAGQAGIAKEDILAFTEAAALVGTAFDISAEQAGDSMAKLMTGLGLTLDEAVSLTDAMNHLSNSQAATASEVLDVVRRTGAMGKQYGFNAEQVAAFGSAMVASGAQSEVAATSFMNMGRALTRGGSATKRQSAAYKTLGLDAEEVAKKMQIDASGTTVDVMERMAKLPAEIRASIASDLFGDEARALGPLLTNLDLLRESLGLVADEGQYSGSSFAEAAVRAKTFENRMVLFNNAISRVSVKIGNVLIPKITSLIEVIEPVVDWFGVWIDANPELASNIMMAVGSLIAFKGAISAIRFVGLLGKGGALHAMSFGLNTVGVVGARLFGAARASIALQTALGAMGGQPLSILGKVGAGLRGMLLAIPGMGRLSGAIRMIGAALVANPIGLLVAGIAFSAYLIYKHWDAIGPWFSDLWGSVTTYFSGFKDFVAGVFTGDLGRAGEGIQTMWGGVKSFFGLLWEGISTNFKYAWENVIKPVTDALGITEPIVAAWTLLQDGLAKVLDWIGDKFTWLMGKISPAIDALKWVADKGMGAASKIGGMFGSGDSPSPEVGSQRGDGLSGYAVGGAFNRGPMIVGERGPEVRFENRAGFIATNRQMHSMADTVDRIRSASAGGIEAARQAVSSIDVGGIVINAAAGMDPQAIADAVMRRISAAQRGALYDRA